jgi:glycine oxidase
MTMPDVTVMGGGVFGLAIAFACARRGAAVRLCEKRRIGAGASGGLVGALAPYTPENWTPAKQFQFESLCMAEGFWRDVAETGGHDPGYLRGGRLQPLADERAIARAELRTAQAAELWQERASWQVVRLADTPFAVAPLHIASATGLAVHDTLSARLNPRGALTSLATALRALGAEILEGTPSPPPARGPVVWATGWEGLAELSGALGREVGGGVKGQAITLRNAARRAPQIFAEGLHIVPHDDGTVAIGSTSERSFDTPDRTDGQLDALLERARTLCPALKNAPEAARWAGVRPRAVHRNPIIDAWPGRAGHFIANGGFKIGFGLAPKVAETMASLVLDGENAAPAGFRLPPGGPA